MELKDAPEAGPDALQEIEARVAQVIARHPNDPFAYALRSEALEAQGKLVLASELAEKARALPGGGNPSRRQESKCTHTTASEFWTRFSPRWPEDVSSIYFGRCLSCEDDSDIYQATWRVTPPPPLPSFLRGEANDDGRLDLSDAVFVLGFLFLGTMEPGCREALDANDDDAIDLSDAIGILGHLFLGSPPLLPGMGVCEPLDGSATFGCEGASRECGV